MRSKSKLFFSLLFTLGFGLLTRTGWSQDPIDQKLINELLDVAFNAYVENDFNTAMLNFQKALQIDSNDETALRGLKQCRDKLGKNLKNKEKDIKLLRKMVKNKQWIDAIDRLRDILEDAPNLESAVQIAKEMDMILKDKMSSAPPGSGEENLYRGFLSYMHKRYDQAVLAWEEVKRVVPSNAKIQIYIEKAKTLQHDNSRIDALTDGRKRAKVAWEEGDYEQAAVEWKKILEFEPYNEEAKAEYLKVSQKANEKNRRNQIGVLYDSGLTFFQADKYADSLEQWESILELDPENEVAADYVKKIHSKGVKSKPKKDKTIPSSHNPGPVAPVFIPGSVSSMEIKTGINAYDSKDYPAAVSFFEDFLIKKPNHIEAKKWISLIKAEQAKVAGEHYRKGLIGYSHGDLETAVREWQNALKVDPEHAQTKRALLKARGGR